MILSRYYSNVPEKARYWLRVVTLSIIITVAVFSACQKFFQANWYSQKLHYAHQVDAFLRGELALSHDISDINFDLAWHDGGVHQVWGLGIPAWRLPFTLAFKAFGVSPFPDRFALILVHIIASIFVIHTWFTCHPRAPGRSSWSKDPATGGLALACIMILAYPPLMMLLYTVLDVYEEAITYTYLISVIMGCLTIMCWRRPRWSLLAWISLLAGISPHVRPVGIFYGTSAMLAAAIILTVHEKRFRPIRIAFTSLPFVAGLAILLVTNNMRFGSPLEFGHSLNINNAFDAMYATRFDSPFKHVSLWVAAKELFGSMFLISNPIDLSFLCKSTSEISFPFQANVPRWRCHHLHTYNLTYLPFILCGVYMCLGSLLASIRQWRTSMTFELKMPGVLAILTLPPILALVYLHCRWPVIASRYLFDFAASLGFLMAYVACEIYLYLRDRKPRFFYFFCWAFWWAALLLWSWQPYNHYLVDAWHVYKRPSSGSLPAEYTLDTSNTVPVRYPLEYTFIQGYEGVLYNAIGWNRLTGMTKVIVTLFVDNVEFIELDLYPRPEAADKDPEMKWVQAKIGLEYLERVSETPITWSGYTNKYLNPKNGKTIRFSGPKRDIYKHGTQELLVGLVPPDSLNDKFSPFWLTGVRWKTSPGGNHPGDVK